MLGSAAGWAGLFFVLGLAGTWLALRYARWRNLVDHPGERRSHAVATPRGGGIAIVIALLVAIGVLVLRFPASQGRLALAGAGLVLVAAIGWIDDHRPLSPWLRLSIHACAAMLLAIACLLAGRSGLHAVAAFGLAVVLVNVWNFMDGIDGIATTQAALVAGTIALGTTAGTPVVGLALALLGACLGFLPFNFPKARVFLGDVGSGALGYALAVLIAFSAQGIGWIWLLLPLSTFLVDATLTLVARMVGGERWWTPHVTHLYQQLVRRWESHLRVTALYAGCTLLALGVAWSVRSGSVTTIIFAVCAWYLTTACLWIWSRRMLRRPQ